MNWKHDGYLIRNFVGENGKLRSRPQNTEYYFRKSITYSYITSGVFNARIKEAGFVFDVMVRQFSLKTSITIISLDYFALVWLMD